MQAIQTTNTSPLLRNKQQHLVYSTQVSPASTAPTVIASLSTLQLRLKIVIVTIGQVSASSPLAATLKMALNWVSPTATPASTEASLLQTVAHRQLCLLAGKMHLLTSALLQTTNW